MVSVHVEGLVKEYAGQPAVDHLSLDLPSGAFVTFLGPSGCGKTTTLRSIAGLDEPDKGKIQVGGETFFDSDHRVFVPPERRRVGMVFQSYALWPHLSVAQNVGYPLRRQKWKKPQIASEVDRFLELVGLTTQRDRSVSALSGGQQQRVALARSMVGNPVLVLFDEPLSNLDVKLRDRMRMEIRRLHDQIGMTSIYVTHDQEEAFTLSDLVVVMNAGRLQQVGTPNEVYFQPANEFVADFVGFQNRLTADLTSVIGGHGTVTLSNGIELPLSDAVRLKARNLTLYARMDAVYFAEGPERVFIGRGRIRATTYFGDAHEVEVDTSVGKIRGRVPAQRDTGLTHSIGDEVQVYLDPTRLVPVVAPHRNDSGVATKGPLPTRSSAPRTDTSSTTASERTTT